MRYLNWLVVSVLIASCVAPIKREYQPHDGAPVMSQSEAIRLTIREHVKEAHDCFEHSTTGHADLNGKVVLDWRLDREGNVREAHVKQALDPKVDACLLAALESWTFPPPPMGAPNTVLTHAFVNGSSMSK